MKSYLSLMAAVAVFSASALFATEANSAEGLQATLNSETTESHDVPTISKAFGHLIGQNLQSLGLEFDMPMVIKGIEDSVKGIDSPLSEAECIQAISQIQENAFKKQCSENLAKAEEFLEKNKKAEGVVELEPGKLQYVQLEKGTGAVVEEHNSPVIRYVGKFIDGRVFGESQDTEVISLDETIMGFNKAIVGMSEGEKRRIFIHPEFGYGTTGFLPPNSLLTFDIEVVKANAPKSEGPSLSTTHDIDSHIGEIAGVDLPEEGIQ